MAITDLTDEEFAEYIEGIRSGELPDESPESAEEVTDNAEGNAEIAEEKPEIAEENAGAAEEAPEAAEENLVTAEEAPDGTEAAAQIPQPEAERAEPQGTAEEDGRITRLLRLARVKYPDEDEGAALERLLGDMEDEEAAGRGMNREDFISTADEADEFDRWKREKAENTQMREKAAEKVREWRADEERIKMITPAFSLEKAMENEEFKKRVLGGESVFAAYAAMNPKREEKTVRAVDEAALAAPEGQQSTKAADPSKLPKAQFDEYIRRIRENG